MRRSRRIAAAVSTLALVPGLLALEATGQASGAAPVAAVRKASLLHPADGVRRARITYTSHGIPHIVAGDSATARGSPPPAPASATSPTP